MKKLILAAICALLLSACGAEIENADIAGDWESEECRVHFNEDGTYEIKYFDFSYGDLASENGKYEIDGSGLWFKLRDKYTLEETGDIKFERLVHTQDRKEKLSLEEDGTLKLNDIIYYRKEPN